MVNHNHLDASLKNARIAIDLMERHQIMATAENFAIWFSYAQMSNPDLVKAINKAVADKMVFTEAFCQALYQEFFVGVMENDLKEMGERVQGAVNKVIDSIGSAVSGAHSYGQTLEAFSGKLAQSPQPPNIGALVQKIFAATQTMIEINTVLSSQLQIAASEANQLKHDVEELKLEANIDHLTKLHNRKWFDHTLTQEQKTADEFSTPLSLIMLDIDHFKKFNDTYGHQLGDQVIKLVARIITECLGDNDIAARYGGEEFSVILPDCTLEQAFIKAEAIRKKVSERKVTNRATGKVLGQITLSAGIAQHRKGEEEAELISRSDNALYFAKGNGRNQVSSENQLVSTKTG